MLASQADRRDLKWKGGTAGDGEKAPLKFRNRADEE